MPPAPVINLTNPGDPAILRRELEELFVSWVDWFLGRKGKSPEITAVAKIESEMFDDDIKAGKIARNFVIHEEGGQALANLPWRE